MNTIDRFKKTVWILSLILVFFSCSKEIDLVEPELNVTVSSSTVKKGEPVKFNIEGNPDIITFFSGEIGRDYEYVNKERILPLDEVNLSFQSQVRTQGGSAGYCQDDQFHILISNNLEFNGNTRADSMMNISNAIWTDLTDKFTLCPLECKSTTPYTYSEQFDVFDLIDLDKPLFIAFKYINRSNAENGNATIWRFQSFSLSAKTEAGVVSLLNQGTANWQPFYVAEKWGANAFSNSGSQVTLRGLTANSEYNELWCVSKAVNVENVNLGREYGIAIKSLSDIPLKSYEYTFEKEGVYTVTFLGVNANISGKKQIESKLQITVTP